MSVKKIDKQALDRWVDTLIGKHTVYGVTAKGERFVYARLTEVAALRLDFDVTMIPPKKYFLPQEDPLLAFDRQGGCQSVISEEPFILFGVHPYDVVAIAQMDAVFAKDHADIHYLTRRENATIVACDVVRPSAHVFAACMGAATADAGFDVLLTLIGESCIVDARTAKGEELLKELTGARKADAASLARREQVWEDARRFLRMHQLNCRPEELPALLADSYDHPIWAERAARCHSCGSCNLVCPTCYCFDMLDDPAWDLAGGKRSRRWDGCMLADFALVAGGHNFRRHREDRYRHRYYRKGKYLWDRMQQIACVGCGRCITACTTLISHPVEVYNALLEDRPR